MTIRTKELLALSALGCLMAAWTVGAAIKFFSRLGCANLVYDVDLLTPSVAACGSAMVLVCILHFLHCIAHEPLPSVEMQDAQENAS